MIPFKELSQSFYHLNFVDGLYPSLQEDLDAAFNPSRLDDEFIDYPSSPLRDHPQHNTPCMLRGGQEKCAYSSPIKHTTYDGDSFFFNISTPSLQLCDIYQALRCLRLRRLSLNLHHYRTTGGSRVVHYPMLWIPS